MMIILLLLNSLFLSPVAQETPGDCKSLIALYVETEEGGNYYVLDGETYEATPIDLGENTVAYREAFTLQWSPDGISLIIGAKPHDSVNNSQGYLYQYSLDNRQLTPLVEEPSRSGRWSPNGRFVAYYDHDEDLTNGLTMNLLDVSTGEIISITKDEAITFEWSHQDNLLYLVNYGSGDVFTFDVNVGKREPLTLPDTEKQVIDLIPSPDGQKLVLITTDGDTMHVVNLETGTSEFINPSYYAYNVYWKPDSSAFAFIPDEGYLHLHTPGGDTIQLEKPQMFEDLHIEPVAWSPDGERLLIAAGKQIRDVGYVENLYVMDGNKFKKIWSNSQARLEAQWSPCLDTESE